MDSGSRFGILPLLLALMVYGAACHRPKPAEPSTTSPAAHAAATPTPSPTPPAGSTPTSATLRTIDIQASEYEFIPSELHASPGQNLRIHLSNRGRSFHNIEFHFSHGGVRLTQPLAPGEETTFSLSVPEQVGVYRFFCPLENNEELGMKGTLLVYPMNGGSP